MDSTPGTRTEAADDGPAAAAGAAAPATPRWRFRPVLTITVATVVTVAVAVALTAFGRPSTSLAAAKGFSLVQVGQPDRHVSLAGYKDRPVIVNFFASWCTPCKRETPLLARFYREHHGQVAIVGVDSNDQAAAALKFMTAAGVNYPVGADPFPAAVTTSYGVIALPQTFLLNSKHQIVMRITGAVTAAELNAWAATTASGGNG
jgi:thiol-disulfide isomerase/thioredoxin